MSDNEVKSICRTDGFEKEDMVPICYTYIFRATTIYVLSATTLSSGPSMQCRGTYRANMQGFGYQCSHCSMLFISRSYKYSCGVTEADMIYLQRVNGERDAAKAIMTKFIRQEQNTVKTVDELRQRRPIIHWDSRGWKKIVQPHLPNLFRLKSLRKHPLNLKSKIPPLKVPKLEISVAGAWASVQWLDQYLRMRVEAEAAVAVSPALLHLSLKWQQVPND